MKKILGYCLSTALLLGSLWSDSNAKPLQNCQFEGGRLELDGQS